VNLFYTKFNRYPGDPDASIEDVVNVNKCLQELLDQWNIKDPVDIKYVQEIVRYGASELHTIASFIGGVASQEIIKLITHQYVPLDNTFIFNGISSTSTVTSL